MRRVLVVLVLISALELGLATSASARATTSIVNQTIPIHTVFFGDCIGELQVNGAVHLVHHLTFDSAGGVHLHGLESYRFTGTRVNTGDKYRTTSVSRFTYISSDRLPLVVTNVVAEHFISPTAPDLLVHIVFHTTIRPDGTATSRVDRYRADCR